MSVAELSARFGAVDDEAGARIERRRTQLGMSVKALAERAGIDRGVLARIEKGEPARSTSVRLVERALDELEHEMGMDVPSIVQEQQGASQPEMVRFIVEGVYGAKALIVEVPPNNIADLEAAVDRIMRNLRGPE